MKKNTFKKYFGVPLAKSIRKSDTDSSIFVTGKFTSDNTDELGDVITRGATERAIPAYRQWGNIRYMHLPRPVGKVVRIGESDGLAWNEVEIKVVDPQAAFEVEQGLLAALSVGILVKWDDIEWNEEDGTLIINDYTLAEISLVDHPANYDAKLDLGALPEGFREVAAADGIFAARKAFGLLEEGEEEEVISDEETLEIEEAQEAESMEKSPACRQEGETMDDCVSRKIPEILDENPDMDVDQATAIAYSMCEEMCDDEGSEEEEIIEETAEEEISESLEIEEEVVDEEPEEEIVVEENISTEVVIEEEEPTQEVTEEAEEVEETSEDKLIKLFTEALASLREEVANLSRKLEVSTEDEDEELEESEEGEEAPDVATLLQEVETLKATVNELKAELDSKSKPANRQAAVRTVELEEETDEASEEEVEEVSTPTSLKESLKAHFKARNLYTD